MNEHKQGCPMISTDWAASIPPYCTCGVENQGFGSGHATSPEKNFNEKIAEYAHVILNADTESDAYGILHAFVQATLGNQRKEIIGVLEGMVGEISVWGCQKDKEALEQAITNITNL